MEELIREYQAGITALQRRREELFRQRPKLQGEAYCQANRRLQALQEEEEDMLFALRLLVRGRGKDGGTADRPAAETDTG